MATTNTITPIKPIGPDDVTSIIQIDSGQLSLSPNMTFGNFNIRGSGRTVLNDGHIAGANVKIETKIDNSNATIEVASSGITNGILELTSDVVPADVAMSVTSSDLTGQGPANGIILDSLSATNSGGPISLALGYVQIPVAATSFSVADDIYSLFKDQTVIEKVHVMPADRFAPLQVGVANGNTYIYNTSPANIPGLAGQANGGMQKSFAVVDNTVTPLPLHG